MGNVDSDVETRGPREVSRALQTILLVLAAGDLVFLLRALTPAASLVTSLTLIAGLVLLARAGEARLRGGRAALWFGVALVVLVLGGEGRLVAASEDWAMRDAVLRDLGQGVWPVVYPMADGLQVLRAPLGMYMVPALAGHAAGAEAGQGALLVQNAVLLAAVLAAFAAAAPVRSRGWIVAAVLLAFSGWDVVGQFLVARERDAFPMHIERWAGRFEYSSTITGLFWAPNHALPALAYAGAHLAWRRGAISGAVPGAVAALSLLWSPLAVIGMIPFVLLVAATELRSRRIDLPAWGGAVLAGVAMLPAAIYLRIADSGVAHGWNTAWRHFADRYPLFVALEVGPLAALAWTGGPLTRRLLWPEVTAALAALVLLPLYQVGVSNDLMMRAAGPALALLAAAAGLQLGEALDRRSRVWAGIALAILAIGAATPLIELARPFTRARLPLSDRSAPQVWAHSTYAVRDPRGRLLPMSTYAAPVEALRPWAALLRQPTASTPVVEASPDRPPPVGRQVRRAADRPT